MSVMKLVIGDYKKSSWSLRAWLVLVTADVPFEVIQIKLEAPQTGERILAYSASGKVPVLLQDDLSINDSLAICEYVAEHWPQAQLWPADAGLKALARSACAEMHAGFIQLRTQLPFGVNRDEPAQVLSQAAEAEIQRVFSIWRQLLARSQSEAFLCGTFGVVDAMFAPVLLRFMRYGIAIPEDLKPYADAVLLHPPVLLWLKLAMQET
ncbi:glutathione S-transferase family protein [Pseudomonas sp. MWU12-2534b]|uniref:glutathione S-transferase family protein n=1 Tax=Pseudomonas TaxID=286 RepID=UPI0006424DA4|nr:glutathione S-transferase family protein [Pseudomonas fluorescens]RBJ79930.1 glutathione S-transferase family protein [Pseudomonas sp. MWU12-2534b]